jgi:hypothetical protein
MQQEKEQCQSMKVVNFFTHFILQLQNLIKNKLFSDLHKSQKCIENRIILQNHVFCTNEIITFFYYLAMKEKSWEKSNILFFNI